MTRAVIIEVIRSPFAKGKASRGALSALHPVELLAQVLRQLLDRSHRRAAEIDLSGELVPVTLPEAGCCRATRGSGRVPRSRVSRSSRQSLTTPEMTERFPEIDSSIIADNSSQLADGAAAVLIASEESAAELGMTPRTRFRAFALAGADPIAMLTAPIPATEKLLRRCGLTLDDIEHYEVNEAFAPVPLAWQAHFAADEARLNPRRGAIALRHRLGASSLRLLTAMLAGLESTGGRYGLQTMCEAGGMANATLIERI